MNHANNLPDWPEPVLSGLLEKHVSLARLSIAQKKQVWAHIQTNNPALADLLTSISSDRDIQELIKFFGAEIRINEADVPQEIINELASPATSTTNANNSHTSFSPS